MTPEELFEANLPLAAFALHKYQGQYDEDDLQEAYLALWKAAQTYQGDRAAFSTYAVKLIHNHMGKRQYTAEAQCRRADREKVSLFVTGRNGAWTERDIPCHMDMAGRAAVSEFWRRARVELPEREYRILRAKTSGYTYAEISRVLSISKQAVTQLIRRRPMQLAREVFGVCEA